jgi:predicted O-linked N-acetylglucosamine transferase (SPINDLY family)
MRCFTEALASAGQAVALAPGDATAELARGTALLGLYRPSEAVEAFRRAVALRPGFAEAQDNLALALVALGQSDAAEDASARAFKAALAGERDGRLAEEICAALRAVDRLPAIYADAAQLQAARDGVAAALATAEDRLGRLGRRSPAVAAALRRTAFRASGFYIAYQQQDDREVMRCFARVLSDMLGLPAEAGAARVRRPGPIRLGIASEQLYSHNGAWWALDWLAELPQRDYAFFTYAFHEVRDPVADGFARLGTHRSLPFREDTADRVLAAMRADDLDILMLPDIGMTPSSRVLSLHRVAPVQFTAWGHPVTSGSPSIDYYLSSDLMEPPGAEAHYTEQLVRLPNLGLFLRPAPPVAGEASFGLPEGRILLGCLQSLFKYLPAHDAVLPAIAREVPEALFVFLEGQPAYMTTVLRGRLAAAFAAAGLDADRHVVFLPRQSYEAYRLLAGQMDVCLDSIGWSGGNSTLEAIEAGVPVVTLPGAFMRGRHSAAILGMMGLQELVAVDAEDYVAKVVALARDPALRAQRRQDIKAQKARLYEDRAFIAALDAFLKSRVAA